MYHNENVGAGVAGGVDFRGTGLVVQHPLTRRSSGAWYGLDLQDTLIGGLCSASVEVPKKRRGRPFWSLNVRSLHKPPSILHRTQVPTNSVNMHSIYNGTLGWLRVAFRLYLSRSFSVTNGGAAGDQWA